MQNGTVWFFKWEEIFIIWLQQIGQDTFIQNILIILNKIFTFLGDDYLCIGILGFIYWGLDKKKGERIGAVFMSTNVSTTLLKNLFYRVRPYASTDSIKLFGDIGGYSFPSGHCTKCTIYPSTAYEYRNKRWMYVVAAIIPLLCGLSRCYLGAHWPTDVIVGLLTGFISFILIEWGLEKVNNKYFLYMCLIIFHGIGLFYCTTNGYFDSYGMLIGFTVGILFEEKYIHFENTDKMWLAIIRTVSGGILYLALNTVFNYIAKIIFEDPTIIYRLFRIFYNFIITFILIGVYPYLFKFENYIKCKKSAIFPKQK